MWSYDSTAAPNNISTKDNLIAVLPMYLPVILIVALGSLFSMALPTWRAIKIAPMEVIRVE